MENVSSLDLWAEEEDASVVVDVVEVVCTRPKSSKLRAPNFVVRSPESSGTPLQKLLK